jgi:hypothetical protein
MLRADYSCECEGRLSLRSVPSCRGPDKGIGYGQAKSEAQRPAAGGTGVDPRGRMTCRCGAASEEDLAAQTNYAPELPATRSFLALLLRKDLDERLAAAGVTAEWADIVPDLDRVEQVTVEQGSKRFLLLPQAPGCAGSLFQAVGVALPPLLRQLPNATSTPAAKSLPQPPKRRGRPRRGATSP